MRGALEGVVRRNRVRRGETRCAADIDDGLGRPAGIQGFEEVLSGRALRNGASVSMGMGKMMVEFFSAATSTRVCK